MNRSFVVVFGMLASLSCAPSYHTAEPYRFNPPAAAELEALAARECAAKGEPAGKPTEPFRTDGCSMWPDEMFTGESWQECCVKHDIAYWCGGTSAMRQQADDELDRCVGEHYHAWMGTLMEAGVRVGGPPWVPMYWRWGYGHKFPSGYSSSDE